MLRVFDVLSDRQAEVENTTTEGSLAQTSFPAGFWSDAGKVIMFHGAMTVVDNNSTDTATLRVRFGTDGSTLSNDDAVAASAAVDVADADLSMVRGTAVCRDVGDGTRQLVFSGTMSDSDAAGLLVRDFMLVSTAFDPAVATYLTWSLTWSVAHADNEAACEAWNVLEAA